MTPSRPRTLRLDDVLPASSTTDGLLAAVLVVAAGAVLSQIDTPYVFNPADRAFNPLIVLPAVLAALAGVYGGRAFRQKAIRRRFGVNVLELDGPLRLGGTLRGRMTTSRPLSAPEGFRLRLRCIERKGSSFDETRRRTQDAVLWESTHAVRTGDSSAGVPVEFLVPPTALADAKLGAPDWTLRVDAFADGAPFQAVFVVPMYDESDDDADDEGDADGDA